MNRSLRDVSQCRAASPGACSHYLPRYFSVAAGLLVAACAVSLVVGVVGAGEAMAQPKFPSKPVRLILAFPPGGASDFAGRLLAQRMSDGWGQTVVVENRAGAGGNVGAEVAARATPDGYTMMLANNAILVANPALYPKLNYDPARDFIPVTLVALQPNVLVVHPSLPVKSVKELIALAKRRPGQLNYASSGVGLAAHLAGELFNSMAGVNMVHVPYKGAGPALADLIGGQTQVMFATATSVIPQIKAGKLRALATTAPKRSIGFEDLPTVSEAGVAGFDATSWHGIVVPTGTPRPIVDQISAAVNTALKNPDLREKFLTAGAEPVGGTPEQFAAYIKGEVPRWVEVIRQSGAKAE